mmetsp:Transcript_14956/g.42795  ORF Transcript_14956/g.42795 Transcript_14956/m.42795 type:complete len:261 (-) Transcript_14956:50-832(-)
MAAFAAAALASLAPWAAAVSTRASATSFCRDSIFSRCDATWRSSACSCSLTGSLKPLSAALRCRIFCMKPKGFSGRSLITCWNRSWSKWRSLNRSMYSTASCLTLWSFSSSTEATVSPEPLSDFAGLGSFVISCGSERSWLGWSTCSSAAEARPEPASQCGCTRSARLEKPSPSVLRSYTFFAGSMMTRSEPTLAKTSTCMYCTVGDAFGKMMRVSVSRGACRLTSPRRTDRISPCCQEPFATSTSMAAPPLRRRSSAGQ